MVTTPPVHIASARSSGPQHTSPSTASHSSVTPIANGRSQKRQHNLFGPYRLLRTLGEGEFGKVKLASHLDTKQEVAIKLIKKESIEQPSRRSKLMREISILQAVDHPFIVKVYEVIETRDYIGMIMEYASGGELFEHILAHRYLKEKEACRFFAQLVAGVSYLHSQNIVHRDLKLENLLLDGQRNVIITDFGFANRSSNDPESLLLTSCGSPCYAAPELVISDGYVGEAADIWSCGVILYAMLCGYLPFDDDPNNPDGDNINLLYKYILETELEFPDYVSQDARDLLKRMLVPDPRYRANMREVMNHWWLQPCAYFYAEEQSRVENKDLSTVAADDETSDEIVPLPKTPTPRPDSIYNTPPDTPRPVSIEEEPSIGVGVVPDMDSKVMDVDREEPSNYELGAYVTTKTSVGSAMSGIRVDDADALVPTVSMEVKAESVAVDHGLVPTASIVHEVARAAESDSSSEPDVIVIDDEHSGSQENQEDSDGPMVAIVHQASDGQTTAGTVGNSFTISSDIDVPAAVSRTPSVRDAVVPTAVRPVTAERRNSRAVAFSGKDALPVEGDVLVIEDEAEIQRQRDRERLREREEKKKVDYGRKSLDIRRIQRNESTTSRKSLFGWLRKNGQREYHAAY
ncbi:kinase-like domain-containing protein [Gaertneriomyces semiglobifer]|nr:kinase-like domain-containing protein [Gaertneriomyces semiglobifer]